MSIKGGVKLGHIFVENHILWTNVPNNYNTFSSEDGYKLEATIDLLNDRKYLFLWVLSQCNLLINQFSLNKRINNAIINYTFSSEDGSKLEATIDLK